MNARRTLTSLAVLVAVAGVVVAALAIPAANARHRHHDRWELSAARHFTAGLRTPERAEAAGWFDSGLPCFDNPGRGYNTGGMGLHWLRKAPDGATPDPGKPEALVFDPVTLRLVAVEYVVLKDAWVGRKAPRLFGHTFTPTTLPNGAEVYKLHAWIWKHNPHGLFADYNPRVASCSEVTSTPSK